MGKSESNEKREIRFITVFIGSKAVFNQCKNRFWAEKIIQLTEKFN
jgi:hypothetical protein